MVQLKLLFFGTPVFDIFYQIKYSFNSYWHILSSNPNMILRNILLLIIHSYNMCIKLAWELNKQLTINVIDTALSIFYFIYIFNDVWGAPQDNCLGLKLKKYHLNSFMKHFYFYLLLRLNTKVHSFKVIWNVTSILAGRKLTLLCILKILIVIY